MANALIELVEKSQKREVFFNDLNNYGASVIKCLNEKDEQAIIFTRPGSGDMLKGIGYCGTVMGTFQRLRNMIQTSYAPLYNCMKPIIPHVRGWIRKKECI